MAFYLVAMAILAVGLTIGYRIGHNVGALDQARANANDRRRLDAFVDLVCRTGTRVKFDLTCGGSRVNEGPGFGAWNGLHTATILIQDDDHGFAHGVRDALDGLIADRRSAR